MKKYSGGWTFVFCIIGMVLIANGHSVLGAIFMSWSYYRLGYSDGAKDGRRSVFTK